MANASTISRQLRNEGWNTVTKVKVSKAVAGAVRVVVQTDFWDPTQSEIRATREIATSLRAMGYAVEQDESMPYFMYVTDKS